MKLRAFFEKINEIDKPLARLIKKKSEGPNKWNEKLKRCKNQHTELQRIIRDYNEKLHANKLDNTEETIKFLETYNLPKLNQEETEHLKRPITSNKTESVIKRKLQKLSNTLSGWGMK